jgi:hypothetical protein
MTMTIFKPQDFDATDSTGKTDESEALQKGINAVSGTRSVLDLDGGNWRYDHQLTLKGTVRIRNGQLSYGGSGDVITILAKPMPGENSLGIDSLESNTAKKSSKEKATLIMKDVRIHRIQHKNQVGLQIENGFRVRFNRVDFTNWRHGGTALRLEGVQYGRFEDCLIEEAETSMVITGLHLGPPSTALTFTHCQFRSHFGEGPSVVLLPYNPEPVVAGTQIDLKGKSSGARKCSFEFCYFEDAKKGGFIEAKSTRFLTLLNCYFEDPGEGFPLVELSDEIGMSKSNKILYCTFTNTRPPKDPDAPAQIRIGSNVNRTFLIGNSHAATTTAVEDNGIDTLITQQH